MKTIPLTQGKFAIVDDDDFDELMKYKWQARRSHPQETFYAQRKGKVKDFTTTVQMHRQILSFPLQKDVDHINRNGLDNQKCNLRICSRSLNRKNSKINSTNSSGLRGVSWHKQHQKWYAFICKDYKLMFLGLFNDKNEAGRIVDKKARELFGEFAVLNFPEDE